jgi:glycosyltransferase involved in cell wall biosynthesis
MNCFNGERFLNEAIDSVYSQTYDNWEIIFWDNASIDRSSLIAKNYDRRLKYFLAVKNTPLGFARNLALNEAKGKYISFLDCDDIYLPSKIKSQVEDMESSKAILSYGSWIEINSKGQIIKNHKIKEFKGESFLRLIQKYDVNFQTLMINKELIKSDLLVFDEKLSFSPDFKLVMSIAYFHSNLLVMSDYLAKYRVHSGALSKSHKKTKMIEFETTMKFFKEMNNKFNRIENFDLLEEIFKCRMYFRDSLEDKNYPEAFLYGVKLMMLYFKKF